MPKKDMANTLTPSKRIDGQPCILFRIACSIGIFPQCGEHACRVRRYRRGHRKRRTPVESRPAQTPARNHLPSPNDKGATRAPLRTVAERTGLEPATSGVTGQHSNQLNYRSAFFLVGAVGIEPTTTAL